MRTITVTLWDGESHSFADPALYKVKPDGLLHIGGSDNDCFSFPFTSIKKMETVTVNTVAPERAPA